MDPFFVVPSHGMLLVAALIATGCGGGGGSPSSPSYPAVKGTYGSLTGGIPEGASRLRWIAPDGTVATQECWAMTSIPNQNGARS